jgi:hypothetical protein
MKQEETPAERRERLRKQLDAFHDWPSAFSFKFVLPNEEARIQQLKNIFGAAAEFSERQSRNGNYISFTIKEVLPSAEHVFQRYEAAGGIEGIMSL